jgi:probable phosphoglycerate mutase
VLILVRHGRTQANAEGRLQGRIDLPLDDVGRAQAAAIGRIVGPVDELVTSPLLRARQTAEAITAASRRVDERWVELDYGDHDGTRAAEVPPDVWARLRSDLDYVPAGGESQREVHARVMASLGELAETARTSNVVVVSHVTPIKLAVGWALGCGPEVTWRMHLGQGSICRIRIGEHAPVLLSFNETAEVGPGLSPG